MQASGNVPFYDSIHSSNNKWWINANGQASFEDVYINNVRSGSAFGGVTYDGSATYGGFGGGFWAGHSFGLSGGALGNFNDLVVRNITADLVRARAIDAGFITADTISANYATIGSLDAAVARIRTLEAKKISVNDLNVSGNLNGHGVSWQAIPYISKIDTRTTTLIKSVDFGNKKVTQDTIMVPIEISSRRMYILCEDRG